MFRPTDRQVPLWGVNAALPPSIKNRLGDTWAETFQRVVLPLLLDAEGEFASLYSEEASRPNWSVAWLLGICLLQELYNLDDQAALDHLSFDVRWQHALAVPSEKAYLSRRSFVRFRARIIHNDPEGHLMRGVFDRVAQAMVSDLKLSTRDQRIDATLVTSNVRIRGRVELFRRTLQHFLDGLSRRWPQRLDLLSEELRAWYADRLDNKWFGRLTKDQQRNKLRELAGWLYEVSTAFADDKEVASDESY